jgi:hypothetical protein
MAVTTRQARRAPTDPEPATPEQLRHQRLERRIMLGVLVAFLVLGALEVFGAWTRTVTATGADGVTLSVAYPAVTRPGLPIRWEYTVTRPGGFDGPITLRTTFDYIHLFDISNVEPDAQSATGSGDYMSYTFAPPSGDTLRVSMDGNTEPGFHELPPVTTIVSLDGADAASVTYRTVVVP